MTPINKLFHLEGWIDAGATFNGENRNTQFAFQTPQKIKNNFPLKYNDQDQTLQMNQLYLIGSHDTKRSRCDWDFGGRIDMLFGTDAYWVAAKGMELDKNGHARWFPDARRTGDGSLYGFALPQAYGELNAPIGRGTRIRIGKFYSNMTLDSAMSRENFFYSRSYALSYSVPTTLFGAIADTPLSKNVTVKAGLSNGWDKVNGLYDGIAFIGGISWKSSSGNTSIDFTLITGSEAPAPDSDNALHDAWRTTYSLKLQKQLTARFGYALEHVLGSHRNGAFLESGNPTDALWYGINQYFIYKVNNCLNAAARFEWFQDAKNSRVFPVPGTTGNDYTGLTLGLNWKPKSWFVLRPEIRWDSSDVKMPILDSGPFRGNNHMFTFAIDALVQF